MHDFTAVDSQSALPCRRCGAPTAEVPSHSTQRHVVMRCSFCNQEEQLPAEASARVKALARRLKEVGWVREAREAPALRMVSMAKGYEGTLRAGGVVVTIVAVLSAVAALATTFKMGPAFAAFVFFLPTASVSMLVGYFVFVARALHECAIELRPLLEGVPPRVGAALGCRVCGAPLTLTSSEGAFVVCAFCAAPNLIGASDTEHQAQLLLAQLQAWREALSGAQPRVQVALSRHAERLNAATMALVAAFILMMFAFLGGTSLL